MSRPPIGIGALFQDRTEIRYVVQRERTQYDVEALGRKIRVLDRRADVAHIIVLRPLLRLRKHFFGDVYAGHGERAVFRSVFAMPAVAAAEVKHSLSAKVRKHRAQCRPLARRFKAAL